MAFMPSSLFFPLDRFQPSEIIAQYSEWIYFTLLLIFFISIAGITLRKHFDRPYVKPLIISVGLMMTFAVFRFKEVLTTIFEGWGILGTIILVIVVATIPYGLCRGFGMPAGKAFYLSYILIYILSWVKYPQVYETLGDKNLGLVNLGLLILFFVAIYKMIRFSKLPSFTPAGFKDSDPIETEINHDLKTEVQEERIVTGEAEKISKLELRTVQDIANALAEIQRVIETHGNNLPKEERLKLTRLLTRISKEETIFMKEVQNLQKLFQRLDAVDLKHLQELKDRISKVDEKERQVIRGEIGKEEEKIRVEKALSDLENKLAQEVASFNQLLSAAVAHLRNSPYPYESKTYLSQARTVLADILMTVKETYGLEEKLNELTKSEKDLLKKERKTR